MEEFWVTLYLATLAGIATVGAVGANSQGICAGAAVFLSLACITYKMK